MINLTSMTFLRGKNGGYEMVSKECKAAWRSKVKYIQAWESKTSGDIQTKCLLSE